MKVYERYRVVLEFTNLSQEGSKHLVFNFKEKSDALKCFNEKMEEREDLENIYLCRWYQFDDGLELYKGERIIKEWSLVEPDFSYMFR
jgi:hypothetical protein